MTMLHGISRKTLRDQQRGLLVWATSLALLVTMYVAIWPSIRSQPAMRTFYEQMPKTLRALLATTGADLSTASGYVQVELLAFTGPTLLLIYAITTGAAAIAGEEAQGTADLLLACPVSRSEIVLRKTISLAAGVFGLCLVMGVVLIGEGAAAGMNLSAGHVIAALTHLALLALVFGALAMAVGAATGNTAASRAVPAIVAVFCYVVNGLGAVISWLRPVRKLSPFYQYSGHDPLHTGYSVAALLAAAATVVALTIFAAVSIRSRDLAAR